jgi:chromosome segregation ATPase
LKEELESTKKENEILKNQEKDNRGLNDIIEALSAELATVENTLTGLYTERDLFMKEKLDLEAANIALKADLQRYIKRVHEGDSNQKTKQLEDQISSLQNEIKRLNSIIDTVGVKLADALKEQSRLEDELAAAVVRGKGNIIGIYIYMNVIARLNFRPIEYFFQFLV